MVWLHKCNRIKSDNTAYRLEISSRKSISPNQPTPYLLYLAFAHPGIVDDARCYYTQVTTALYYAVSNIGKRLSMSSVLPVLPTPAEL